MWYGGGVLKRLPLESLNVLTFNTYLWIMATLLLERGRVKLVKK